MPAYTNTWWKAHLHSPVGKLSVVDFQIPAQPDESQSRFRSSKVFLCPPILRKKETWTPLSSSATLHRR